MALNKVLEGILDDFKKEYILEKMELYKSDVELVEVKK